MLAKGVTKEPFSKWSTPIVMAKKANGGYRLCLDFRKLNAVSKKDAYPIPYVSAILMQQRCLPGPDCLTALLFLMILPMHFSYRFAYYDFGM